MISMASDDLREIRRTRGDALCGATYTGGMVERRRRRAGICLALVALLVGCSAARKGMRVEHDSIAKSDGVVGRARTTEPDGLRVLWNGQVLGHDFKQRGFIAGNRRQFAALWRKVHPPRDEPAVDLSKYVVLAVVGMGSICPTEVMGVRVDAQDVLRLEHIRVRAPNPSVTYTACSDVGVRRALVLAVPRTLLSSSVTFVEEEAFEFSVPKPGEPAAEHQDPTRAQTGLSVPRGESVELPVRGSITLRTLSNGAQVWVAHQRDGSVNVLSSLISRRDILDRIQPYESPLKGVSLSIRV